MAVTATPIFPQSVQNFVTKIQNADASNIKTLVTGGTNGTKVESIIVSSTDTSARDVNIYITVSSVNYLLTTISIPINSGNANNIAATDILRSTQIPALPFDNKGNKYIYIANGATLGFATTTTVTSGKEIDIFAQGGNF